MKVRCQQNLIVRISMYRNFLNLVSFLICFFALCDELNSVIRLPRFVSVVYWTKKKIFFQNVRHIICVLIYCACCFGVREAPSTRVKYVCERCVFFKQILQHFFLCFCEYIFFYSHTLLDAVVRQRIRLSSDDSLPAIEMCLPEDALYGHCKVFEKTP